MTTRILIFVGMAGVGAAVAWANHARTAASRGAAVEQREVSPVPPPPRPAPTSADLIKVVRKTMEDMLAPGFSIYSEELGGWTSDEIRAALNEALTNKEFRLDSPGARMLASALLSEWMKRDCDGAIQWYLTTTPPAVRAKMALLLSRNWPPDQPEKGLAFLKAHQDLLPGGQGWSILVLNLESRAMSGPAAVGMLLAELRAAKIGLDFGNPLKFPADFDFPGLMIHPEMQALEKKDLFLQAWKAQDRDGAFEWLLKNEGVVGLTVFASSPMGITKDELEWLGNRFENLAPAQRSEFVSKVGNSWINSPAGASSFIAGIREPQVADEAREFGVQLIFTGKIRDAVPLLDGVSDPAKRLAILETAQPRGIVADNPHMRRFTPADEAILRKSLADWNASTQQAETIIAKFKP